MKTPVSIPAGDLCCHGELILSKFVAFLSNRALSGVSLWYGEGMGKLLAGDEAGVCGIALIPSLCSDLGFSLFIK